MSILFKKKKEQPPFDIASVKSAATSYVNIVYCKGNAIRYSRRDTESPSQVPNDSNIKFSDRGGTVDSFDDDDVYELLRKSSPGNFEKVLKGLERTRRRTFVEEVQIIISSNGLRDSQVYKAANIDRRLFSKIMSDEFYKPSKDTAFAICFALKLSYDEAFDLLGRAGYTFSHSDKRDIIIEYCFKSEITDINNVNLLLEELSQKTLGR